MTLPLNLSALLSRSADVSRSCRGCDGGSVLRIRASVLHHRRYPLPLAIRMFAALCVGRNARHRRAVIQTPPSSGVRHSALSHPYAHFGLARCLPHRRPSTHRKPVMRYLDRHARGPRYEHELPGVPTRRVGVSRTGQIAGL